MVFLVRLVLSPQNILSVRILTQVKVAPALLPATTTILAVLEKRVAMALAAENRDGKYFYCLAPDIMLIQQQVRIQLNLLR